MPQKCHKANNQEAFAGLCTCSCRDMSKDHSTPNSRLPSPTKRTKLKTPLCKQQGATDFPGSLFVSRGSFSFLSNKSYFVCHPCLMSQFFGPWRRELWTLVCNVSMLSNHVCSSPTPSPKPQPQSIVKTEPELSPN
jgi:hypothetical protein